MVNEITNCLTNSNQLGPGVKSCSDMKNVVGKNYTNFKPYSYQVGSISGECCWVPDISSCPKELTFIGQYDCSNGDTSCTDAGDGKAKMCGKQKVIIQSGSMKDLAFLILMSFLAIFVYAVFIIGPFLFWIQFSKTPFYADNCYAGFTILDRHYPYNKEKLPYDWKDKPPDCGKSYRPSIPSINTCPPPSGIKSAVGKDGKLSGSTAWDKITQPFGNWPYNIINSNETIDNEFAAKHSTLFFVFFICCGIYFTMMSAPFLGDNESTGLTVGMSILLFCLSVLFFYLIIKNFVGKKELAKNAVKKTKQMGFMFMLMTIIINIVNGFIFKKPPKHKYALALNGILTLGLFMIGGRISYLPNSFETKERVPINYKFFDLWVKFVYYMKKSFVFSIRESFIWGRKVPNKTLGYIGTVKLIPSVIYILFGKFIAIPIFIMTLILRCIASFIGGTIGAFGHRKINKKTGKKEGLPDTLRCGCLMWLIGMICMPIINMIFFFLSYNIIPLTYPNFMVQTIKCNIKTFLFMFGVAILSAMWTRHQKPFNYDYVPYPVLITMTVTFAIFTIINMWMS